MTWLLALLGSVVAGIVAVFYKYYNPPMPSKDNLSDIILDPPTPPVVPVDATPTPPPPNRVYEVAKACLGRHITLNENVPPDVGCAEAVSAILVKAGVKGLPKRGFESTASLYSWLLNNGTLLTAPIAGDIVISPTGTSTKKTPHGHVGIVLNHGIGSNDSNSGLFNENYTIQSWDSLFTGRLGFPVFYFRVVV